MYYVKFDIEATQHISMSQHYDFFCYCIDKSLILITLMQAGLLCHIKKKKYLYPE